VAEILHKISEDVRDIATHEVALIKLELEQALRQASISAAGMALGGMLGLFSLGLLCMAAVVALEDAVPSLTLRMLLMAVLYLVVGAVLIGAFLKRMQGLSHAAPKARHEAKKTVNTIEQEVRGG